MAKKVKKSIKKSRANDLPDNMLPQNILPIGECVGERQNVYIAQTVYKEIHRFTKNKTTNESGGMLVGSVIEEFGKVNVVISGFIEAKYCEATSTTLTFTHDTWEHVHSELERKHNGKKIVGWIHTHPDFGIFLSEYDKFIQENFFKEDYQVAYVIDPIQNIEGFYSWHLNSLEKCKGFYIYEKTGKNIDIDIGSDDFDRYESDTSSFDFKNVLIGILSVAVVLLFFFNIFLNGKINQIERQQKLFIEDMQKVVVKINRKADYIAGSLAQVGLNIDPNGKLFDFLKIPGVEYIEPDIDNNGGEEEATVTDETEVENEIDAVPESANTEDQGDGEDLPEA